MTSPDPRAALATKIIAKMQAPANNWASIGISKVERDFIVAALRSPSPYSGAAGEACICCANGNDLPDGEYCRACGRENNMSPLGRAVKRARGLNIPPTVPVQFDGPTILPRDAERETIERGDFRWLIEAPGARYLAVQRLSMSDNFEWTTDHNRALAFRSEEQADGLMMAVRQMDREKAAEEAHGALSWGDLFAFESKLGNARAVEHGWLLPSIPPREGPVQSTTEQADASRDHPVREALIEQSEIARLRLALLFIGGWVAKPPTAFSVGALDVVFKKIRNKIETALSPSPASVMPDEGEART